VVVSNIFYFHPYLGTISDLTNIFRMGWFNHQLVMMRATRHGQDSEILGGSSDADLAVSDDSEELCWGR